MPLATTAGPTASFERVGVYGPPDGDRSDFADMKIARRTNGPYAQRTRSARTAPAPSPAAPTGSARKPDHWLFAGTGMKEGDAHPRPGRLGVARRPGADSRASKSWPAARRKRARQAERRHVHRDDLPRPEGQLRLQRRHDLVGRRPERAARLRPAEGLHRAARAPTRACSRSRGMCWSGWFRRFCRVGRRLCGCPPSSENMVGIRRPSIDG